MHQTSDKCQSLCTFLFFFFFLKKQNYGQLTRKKIRSTFAFMDVLSVGNDGYKIIWNNRRKITIKINALALKHFRYFLLVICVERLLRSWTGENKIDRRIYLWHRGIVAMAMLPLYFLEMLKNLNGKSLLLQLLSQLIDRLNSIFR